MHARGTHPKAFPTTNAPELRSHRILSSVLWLSFTALLVWISA